MQLPPFVDLRPVGRCNLSCPFCFGPRHEVPSMSWDTARSVVGVLRDGGVRGVVISGGEPTLLPYLPDLAGELSKPFDDGRPPPRVVLSTNGLAPLKAMHRILPHLSWLALPLESRDETEHGLMRTGSPAPHRDRVLGLLKEVRKNHRHVQVKLGTVVTRLNVKGAPRVLDLAEEGAKPHVWKVYQMSETNYGADNRDWLAIGDEEFEEVVRECEKAAREHGVPLRVYRNRTRTGSYFFIDPDCEIVVVDAGEERRMGNLFERLADRTLRPAELVTPARNVENFAGTYPDPEDLPDL
ncbi:radical SAM protein [Streptomyces sp. NPDC046465]|uniref:radical SAM protein n=1 Tax=Streptomyces sp. NPDC046465 TaxID=3155810 RepID=UPI0033FD7769